VFRDISKRFKRSTVLNPAQIQNQNKTREFESLILRIKRSDNS